MHLLIAESDPALGVFLKTSFEAERYAVDLCTDGDCVFADRTAPKCDAAILDLNTLSDESLNLLRQIRAVQEALPILVLTSRARPEDRVRILDSGADDLVLKPFAFSEVSPAPSPAAAWQTAVGYGPAP